MPTNIAHLRQNIEANGLTMIEVVTNALSDKPASCRWFCQRTAPVSPGWTGDADQMPRFAVKSTTFDDWFDTQPKMDISVCKIDVEGHEAQVLAGMDRVLTRRAIPALVFERHVDGATYADPIFGLFASKRLSRFRIEKGLKRVVYVELEAPPKARPTHDFVAALPGVSLNG